MLDMHVHSTKSDGVKTLEEILEICSENSVKAIGITDHWKTKRYTSNFYVDDMDDYLKSGERLKNLGKSKGIDVFLGLEIDYTEKYGYPIEIRDLEQFNQLDYVLFEYVNTQKESWGVLNGKSIETLFHIRDKIKIPVGLAHNDFFNNFNDNYIEIIKKMKEFNIFLELCEGEKLGQTKMNATSFEKLMDLKKNMSDLDIYKGKQKISKKKHMRDNKFYFEYFPEDLWKTIKQTKLSLSVSTDSHSGKSIGNHSKADEYINNYDLKNQLIFGIGDKYDANL